MPLGLQMVFKNYSGLSELILDLRISNLIKYKNHSRSLLRINRNPQVKIYTISLIGLP